MRDNSVRPLSLRYEYLHFTKGQLDSVGFLGERTFYKVIKASKWHSLTVWKLVIEFNSIRMLDCKKNFSSRDIVGYSDPIILSRIVIA